MNNKRINSFSMTQNTVRRGLYPKLRTTGTGTPQPLSPDRSYDLMNKSAGGLGTHRLGYITNKEIDIEQSLDEGNVGDATAAIPAMTMVFHNLLFGGREKQRRENAQPVARLVTKRRPAGIARMTPTVRTKFILPKTKGLMGGGPFTAQPSRTSSQVVTANPSRVRLEDAFTPVTQVLQERIMVNLQPMAHHELKLYEMYECIRNQVPTIYESNIYIELIREWRFISSETAEIKFEDTFKDYKLRSNIRMSRMLEVLGITIVSSVINSIAFPYWVRRMSPVEHRLYYTSAKNILFYVHQNLLGILELLKERVVPGSPGNVWINAINEAIKKRQIGNLGSEAQNTSFKRNNEIIAHEINVVTIIFTKISREEDEKYFSFRLGGMFLRNIGRMILPELRWNVCRCYWIFAEQMPEYLEEMLELSRRQEISEPQNALLLPSISAPPTNTTSEGVGNIFNQNPGAFASPIPGIEGREMHGVQHVSTKKHRETPQLAQTTLSPPFLPKMPDYNQEKGGFTLVLDLDETLIHFEPLPTGEPSFRTRPGATEFIAEMCNYYELVIFTAGVQEYADWVLDQLDPGHLIKYRLYRQHAQPDGNAFVKDLKVLGRDMHRVIIIDNVTESFKHQPENAIYITTWYDDQDDRQLEELIPLLKAIVTTKVKDVREALRKFRDQVLRLVANGNNKPHLQIKEYNT